MASAAGDQALPARLHGVLPMAGDIPSLLCRSPSESAHVGAVRGSRTGRPGVARSRAIQGRGLADDPGPQHWGRPADQPPQRTLRSLRSCRSSEGQIAEIESAVFGAVAGIVARLRLVTPALWGDAAVEPFSESLAATYSREDVLHVLAELCGDEAEANSILDAASDTADANALRRRLGVALADFNASPCALLPIRCTGGQRRRASRGVRPSPATAPS